MTSLPSLRTVRAVLPHTALQSVVSTSWSARQDMGFRHGKQPKTSEKGIRPALMIGTTASEPGSFFLLAQYRPQPQMVEGHTVANDGRLWTFTLREGLRFHNGEPVRAQDCIASLERWGKRDAMGQKLFTFVQ